MQAWIDLIMDFRCFEGPACCESSNRQRKCVGKLPLCFKLELNTVGTLSVSSDINLKDGGEVNVRAYLEKTNICKHIDKNIFPSFGVGNHSRYLSSGFKYTLHALYECSMCVYTNIYVHLFI